MKQIITTISLLCICLSVVMAQDIPESGIRFDELVKLIGEENIPSGTLWLRDLSKDDETSKLHNSISWNQLQFEIQKYSFGEKNESLKNNDTKKKCLRKGIIPIQVLLHKVNYVDSTLLRQQLSSGIQKNKISTKNVFAASACQDYTLNGGNQQFLLPSEFIHKYGFNELRLWIDFDDGKGLRRLVPDHPIGVSYSSVGIKKCKLKATTGKRNFESNFTFEVKK